MKKPLLASILLQLEEEASTLKLATQAALAAATDEESKPENQYDTRALEASYLAAAQGKRLQEVQRMIEVLRGFPAQSANPVVGSGSLLELSSEGKVFWYFLLPFGAGLGATIEGKKISVVTLDSPLGQALQGRKSGDAFEFNRPGGTKEYEILSVL